MHYRLLSESRHDFRQSFVVGAVLALLLYGNCKQHCDEVQSWEPIQMKSKQTADSGFGLVAYGGWPVIADEVVLSRQMCDVWELNPRNVGARVAGLPAHVDVYKYSYKHTCTDGTVLLQLADETTVILVMLLFVVRLPGSMELAEMETVLPALDNPALEDRA